MSLTMVRPDLHGLPDITSPAGYTLRTYRPGDEAAWCEIMEGAIDTGWTPMRFQKEMVHPAPFNPAGLFFAVHEDSPVATACAWRLDERYGPKTGVLHMVAVRSEHRGRRLGTLVSLAVLHFFQQRGLRDAVLHTDAGRLPAIKTYLALGFRPKLDTPEARQEWARVEPVL